MTRTSDPDKPYPEGPARTGPDHFAEAHVLLARSGEPPVTARAQVHATLALAAAIAMSGHADMPVHDSDAWVAAAGGPCPPGCSGRPFHNHRGGTT
jgi:hypothetical protein